MVEQVTSILDGGCLNINAAAETSTTRVIISINDNYWVLLPLTRENC